MNNYLVPVILSVSILLQLASAVTALLMVRTSGFYKPWIFIASAITLMAVRRITSLQNILISGIFPASSLVPELIALFISILMLTGLLLFKPMFLKIREVQKEHLKKVKEKELLVRESHHHIKNDLQMLASLVRLQEEYQTEGVARAFYRDLELRIKSFALLHEYIYSSGDDVPIFSRYMGRLASAIGEVYRSTDCHAKLSFDIADFEIDRKEMLYCGLVLNEALTNSYKYAFPRGEISGPEINIRAFREGEKRLLRITDNGIGLPPDFNPEKSGSYGLTLIRAIGENEGWVTSVAPASEGPGTIVTLSF